MRDLQSYIESHFNSLSKIIFGFVCIALVLQWSSYAGRLWQHADPVAIVGISDNDSAAGIDVSRRTWLLGDNGWRTYGPIYYRIVSILRHTVSWNQEPIYNLPQQNDDKLAGSGNGMRSTRQMDEKRIHFILMLMNLACIYGLGLLVSLLILENGLARAAFLFAFVPLILANNVRAHLLLLAKPDALFSSLLTLSFVYLIFNWQKTLEVGSRTFKIFAALIGLTAATKLTTLMFFPSLALLFAASSTGGSLSTESLKKALQSALRFFLWVGIFYFAVGFPSTLDIRGSWQYLSQQKLNMSWGDLDFLKIWIQLLEEDLWRPIFLMTIFSFLSLGLPPLLSEKRKIAFLGLSFLALLQLISKRLNPPYEWYVFPFTNVLLISWALFLNSLQNWAWVKNLKGKYNFGRQFALGVLVVGFPYFVPTVPATVDNWIGSYGTCRPVAWKFMNLLNERIEVAAAVAPQRTIALVDPLIPYDPRFHDKEVRMAWDMSEEFRKQKNPVLIAIKEDYAKNYLLKSEGGNELIVHHLENLEATRQYYRQFVGKSGRVKTSDGTVWELVYGQECHFRLWQKVTPAKAP